MGGKKGGGSASVPFEYPNNLFSKQIVKVLDIFSEGPIEGLHYGNTHPFKSLYFNDTPVQSQDGSFNFFGFNFAMTLGEKDQPYLPDHDVVEKTNPVNADLKFNNPITRTITDPTVSSVRLEVGAQVMVLTDPTTGNKWPTTVHIQAEVVKNGVTQESQIAEISGKGSEGYYQNITLKNLPDTPFEIRVSRLTADSNTDNIQNKTIFSSYIETIDAKLSYEYLAVAGFKFDAMQFGSSLPRINALLNLMLVQVPTNYDPIKRTYTGMWDGSFKTAWSDNPAWVMYHFARNGRFGGNLDPRYINRAALYRLAQFCDEMVDDGYGGKEPRITFNFLYTTAKSFRERLQDMASACYGLALWDGQYLTFSLDRDDDPVHIYNNSNVLGGNFTYEGIANSAVITEVHVQYQDKNDGYRQKTEVVEDRDLQRRYQRNIKKVIAEGCDRRSQAHRMGRYILEKSKLQETVSFAVGREGLRHRPHDVIQIADNHSAGANIGGRVLQVEGNKVTLDRKVENTAKALFSYAGEINGKIGKIETEITDQLDDFTVVLKEVTADLKKFTPFNLTRTDVKPKHYRALGVSDNGDGTYSVKAIEHQVGLHDRIAAGLKFEEETNSIWTSFPEITNGTVGNNGDEVIISWNNINADTTELTYTIKLYQDGRLYRTYSDLREPTFKFENLPSGSYVAEIQAKNSRGQLSNILKQYFDLNYTITALTTKSELFSVKVNWQLPAIVSISVSTEIWRSEVDDINQARLLVTLPYPQNQHVDQGMSIGEKYYYWARIIDKNDTTGEFTRSMFGEPKTDPSDILEILDGKISEKQISKDLQDQFDKNINDKVNIAKEEIQSELDSIEIDLTGITGDIDNVKKDASKALKDAEKNAKDIKDQTKVIDEVKVQSETSEALWQLAQMSNLSAQRSEFARSMSMSGQVSNNIANIEELYSFRVTDKEAVAFEFKQMNTRVDNAESSIKETRESLSNEIKAEASKREELEAGFDVNAALQQLSSMTFATSDKSLSSRLFSLSASTANAHARYDALQEVVATNEESRVNSEQRLQAQIGTANAEIQRIDRVMTTEFASQANTNTELSTSIDKTNAALREESEARVESDKAQAKKNETIETEIEDSKAIQQLASMTHSSTEKSFSQRYFMIAAQTAASASSIEALQKSYADLETTWSVSETRLQSQIESSKADIQRIDRTQVEQDKAQTAINEKHSSEIGENRSSYEAPHKTVVDNEKAQTKQNTEFESEFADSKASQQLAGMTQSGAGKSMSQRISLINAQTANNTAGIQRVDTALTNHQESTAESIKEVSAKADSNTAQIIQNETATANVDGKVNALWTLKVDANSAIGGIMLGSDGKESLFKVAADTFVVSNGDQSVNMLTLQKVDGKTVMGINGDLIAKGTISSDMLVANIEIKAPVISGGVINGVEINAGHFYGGSIAIGGTKEDPNFSVGEDGKINAKEGYFGGTIEAKMIKGDIGQIINIPAIRYESLLMWGSRTFIKRFDPVPWERNLQVISSWFINQMNGTFHAGNTFRVSEIRNGARKVLVESSDERIDIYKQGDFIHIPPNVTFSIEIYQSAPTSYTGEFARSNAVKLVDIRSGVVDVEFEVIE